MEKKYNKFYELDIWKMAFELQKEIYELCKDFPKYEQFGIVPQITRSANSVLANIAEADGRFHFLDKIRVLYIARGEIQETQSHLFVSVSRGYIKKDISDSIVFGYEDIKIKLNCYIKRLNAKNKK